MPRFSYDDALIRRTLAEARVVAMVGASPRADRPSHGVMRFLQQKGHRVYPVNPVCAGETIHGETVLAAVADVPEAIDMVDVFRRSAEAGAAVDDAIAAGARIVWMQLDVIDEEAAARAEAAGLTVIMDRCPVIEYRRLGADGPKPAETGPARR
jgi:predicted CoA-binding protein